MRRFGLQLAAAIGFVAFVALTIFRPEIVLVIVLAIAMVWIVLVHSLRRRQLRSELSEDLDDAHGGGASAEPLHDLAHDLRGARPRQQRGPRSE